MAKHHRLGARSLSRLQGVHPELVDVVIRALELSKDDFGVIAGRRSIAEQKELVRLGKSQTMRSRHLTGHAVDLMIIRNNKAVWNDWSAYEDLFTAVMQAAQEKQVSVHWGGFWASLMDGVHFELSHRFYPA